MLREFAVNPVKGATMKQEILLGDEAVGLGAIDAGLSGIYGYPGTPSTEIFEFVERRTKKAGDVHAFWSTNEKVAYEEALGMSWAGKRALVCMKHVGLNVAADAFMNSALTGTNGGLVLAVADDPGMHSSQNEQDSRFFAQFALIPCFEPRNQQESYDMMFEAFDLSEELALPVMILTGILLGSLGLLIASLVKQLENFAGVMNFVIFPYSSFESIMSRSTSFVKRSRTARRETGSSS